MYRGLFSLKLKVNFYTNDNTFLLQDDNLERAADWIFSHAHELDQMDVDVETGPEYKDGPGSKWRHTNKMKNSKLFRCAHALLSYQKTQNS